MEDNPTGLRLSSPTVWKNYITTSQVGETRFPSVALAAPHAITKKPAARPKSPNANLRGIDGLRCNRANVIQSDPNTGASIMMKHALTD